MPHRRLFSSDAERSMVGVQFGVLPGTVGRSTTRQRLALALHGRRGRDGVSASRGSMRRGRVGLGQGMRAGIAALACCALANCSSSSGLMSKMDPRLGVSSSPRVVAPGEPVPKGGGHYQVGAPYVVGGRTYVPQFDPHYRAEGLASWYGEDFHGRLTANGEVYDMQSISAAHPTLPIPSYARVTNLANQRSIIVRVNDRGPYHQNRLIDVSVRTAKL